MKIKVIANRDNGYEESYKFYAMEKDYFRLSEESGMNSEYYSDDDSASSLADEVRAEMSMARSPQEASGSVTTSDMPEDDYDQLFNSI